MMQSTFNSEERMLIDEIFNLEPKETELDDLPNLLHADIYDHLRKNNNLNTIIDRKIIREANKDKPYDAIVLTKFLRPKFDVFKAIKDLVESLNNRFLIYIDFHFMILCPPRESDKDVEEVFRLQTASKASAMNATSKIATAEDCDDLIAEFKNQSDAELLNSVFQHHSDLFDYQSSGLRPYDLLSLVVHVQKYP